MRIGELSARTGASARSIRYYEEYAEAAVGRVLLIRRLFDAGIGSRSMHDLLPCLSDPSIRTPRLTDRLRRAGAHRGGVGRAGQDGGRPGRGHR